MIYLRTLIFLCLTLSCLSAVESAPHIVEFTPSIHRYGLDITFYKCFSKLPQDGKLLALFETLYKKNIQASPKNSPIPKVIHQIWLGGPVPQKFERIMKTWMNWNGWDYKLWTDADAATFPMKNRKLFDSLKNNGAKADVLRVEILYREGGLYADIDFECLNPLFFDWAHDRYDFFAGIETLKGCPKVNLCNALMGAKGGHPFLKQVLEALEKVDKLPKLDAIIDTTGPGLITKEFFEYWQNVDRDTVDIVFTPTYFYPLSKSDFKLKEKEMAKLLKKESAALHHWSGTWLKKPVY